jgi:hypothetical protein
MQPYTHREFSMTADEQLLYEARVRQRQAAVALAAGVLLVLASVLQLTGPHTKVNELTLDLIAANKRFPLDLITSVINGLGSVALAGTLVFLFSAARARNPQLQSFWRIVAMVGGVVAGIAGVAYSILIAIKANQFVTTGSQTYEQAHTVTNSTGILILQLVGQLAALMLAVTFVIVSLNAMRVGLLTRFLGYLGIFGGVLVLFQITPVPIVQAYWLVALAYLFSGRWPTGVPPAWSSGRAEPWPSSASLRQQRAGGLRGGGRPQPTATPAAETVGARGARTSRSAGAKRKRKRRK